MLQQILKEMYVDPDVLNALNEDQKKTLFLKMRQEQVRRWKEREEKLDKEGGDAEFKRTKPKKAKSKNVSWLLGRDGDVAVIVIGEVDELSSKFICSGLGEKKTPSLQNNTNHQTILKSKKPTEPDKTERENLVCNTQPGISLNFKGKHEETSTLLPLPVSVGEHSTPPAAEKPESKSARATEEKSVTQTPICSRSPARVNPINIRPALSNVTPVSVNTRPSVANLKQAAAAATTSTAVLHSPPSTTVKKDSTTAPTKSGPSSQAPQKPQAPQGGNGVSVSAASQKAASQEAGSSGSAPTCTGRGRVAQLMKTFSAESTTTTTPNTQTPAKGIKPPLPTKPSHLRVTTTPTIR